MISFKQLRYFEAVARTRHFGKAAEQCAVTQPALSMQIQELEKTLGVQLLERSRNGIMLTEAGREIAGRANRILADTRDIVDFARRFIMDKGVEVFNFGKHKGRPVSDVLKSEPQYYDWMMRGDFPLHTKLKLTEIFNRTMLKKD